jgi:hypothetical protein
MTRETHQAIESTLLRTLWACIAGGAMLGLLVLFVGCDTLRSTEVERTYIDDQGREIREIQRQEFDPVAFEYLLGRVVDTAPHLYGLYLTIEQQRLELRREELLLEAQRQEMDNAEFQARLDAVTNALADISTRLQAYKQQQAADPIEPGG